jgi:anti-anti-sigma regulatory factor
VRYLDSSGVQLLFELAERLAARQQRLAVAVPPDAPARRVLEIVALDVTAPVANSREEALERLGL